MDRAFDFPKQFCKGTCHAEKKKKRKKNHLQETSRNIRKIKS